jgi:hypothetical protein
MTKDKWTEDERKEHTERLRAMIEDDGHAWDLSDNDRAAPFGVHVLRARRPKNIDRHGGPFIVVRQAARGAAAQLRRCAQGVRVSRANVLTGASVDRWSPTASLLLWTG